jgi:hypothetical protein
VDLERREPVQLQCVTCHGFVQEFQAGLNGLGGLDCWACSQSTGQMALLASVLLMTGQRTMQAEVGSSIPAGLAHVSVLENFSHQVVQLLRNASNLASYR